MRKISQLVVVPALALALGAVSTTPPANAESQIVQRTETTTYKGTVTAVDPTASTIVLRSESAAAPTTYTYNKETVFVDPSGKTVTYDVIKNSPVTVHYVQDGDRMIVTRVEAAQPQVKKETTTTTTTEVH